MASMVGAAIKEVVMVIFRACLVSLIVSVAVGCADDVDDAQSGGGVEGVAELAEVTSSITTQDLLCGRSAGFPTWGWWSTTNVDVSSGSSLWTRLSYHAGAGGTVEHWFQGTGHWSGQWAGATLWVDYLGYYDSSGTYQICGYDSRPPGAPVVRVQTY